MQKPTEAFRQRLAEAFEQIPLGKAFTWRRTFTEADVTLFCGIIGDLNPYHQDELFARESWYGKRIVPGLLTASMITHIGGMVGFLATEMTFETRDAGTLVAPAGSFALAACVGSSHALGGLEATLGRLTELVRPGGHILVGEGFWIRPPAYDELEVLGATQDELPDLSGLLAAGDGDGLRTVYLATATDEGGSAVAAAPDPSTDTAAGTSTTTSTAPRTPPIDGYDAFTVAQLRGRLRGYALSTVEELIAYEQATRDRAPYLTMLRNRLEKLDEQAVESSPLAPRG